MAHYNFRDDLAVAQKTEIEVAKLLSQYNLELIKISDNKDYDILLRTPDGREITFEVKEDFICETTGNVGVEFSCRGKLSGVSTSRADYYIYKLHTRDGIKYVLHRLEELKKMIEDKKYFRTVNGGDEGSNSLFYLFKYSTFVEYGRILPLDKTEELWYNKELL